MIHKKYQNFLDSSLNENVAAAKAFMKNKALAKKREEASDEEKATVKLTPEEIRSAENNRDFNKIKELCNTAAGYTFAFTKFYFEEGVPFDELKAMFNNLKDNKQLVGTLPMSIDEYANIKPTDTDKRKGFEVLGDDMTKVKRAKVAKKWVDNLYSTMKREYLNVSDETKEKIAGIADAFDNFGRESDGSKDVKMNKALQDLFWDKLARYKTLNEVVFAAISYIKAANNGQISKFLKRIQEVNEKFGFLNGAEVIYDENKILIIEVKSYQANKELNANTSHCIASSSYLWDNYVGGDSKFTKQYYIYNFELSPSDIKSVIGITIGPGSQIEACHLKDDAGFSSGIKSYMRSIQVPFDILQPMTKEEQEGKRKRIRANKEIIKPKLTIAEVEQYLEEGADPNAQQGIPLTNAVKEDDLEKTQFLLDKGAMPNIGGAIKGAQNLEMIKLLVSYGANLTSEIYTGVSHDYDAVKYLIDAGLDINFDNGFPLRQACKHPDENEANKLIDLILKHGGDLTARRYMAVKWLAEHARPNTLDHVLKRILEKGVTIDEKTKRQWSHWPMSSDLLNDKQKKQVQDVVNKNIK